MKVILSENQVDKIPSEKLADIFFGWFKLKYPNYTLNEKDEIVVNSDDNSDTQICFYFDEDDDFYVSIDLIKLFFDRTNIKSFDIGLIHDHKGEPRKKFNNIMSIFAKKQFGRNINNVYFHYHFSDDY